LLELLPTLTRLSLSGCIFSWNYGAARNRMEEEDLPQLQLQQVRFHGVPCALTDGQLLALVRRCPELQRLEVKAGGHGGQQLSRQLTDSWLEEVMRSCPRLTCLDLEDAENEWWNPAISEAAVLKAIRQRPKLRILYSKGSSESDNSD